MTTDAALATDLLLRLGHLPSCGEGAEFPWDCTCDWAGAYERFGAVIADAQRWRDAEAEGHIVDFTRTGYGLQHPPSCRPNLTGCAYHLWLVDDDGPVELQGGRYRMTLVRPNGYDEVEYAALAAEGGPT